MSADFGIGTDIVNTERFKNTDKNFLSRLFTQREIDYCSKKSFPEQHYAGRFAAKEAVIKAFSKFGDRITFKDIEIAGSKMKSPRAIVKYKEDFLVEISISHDKDYAVAFSVVMMKK